MTTTDTERRTVVLVDTAQICCGCLRIVPWLYLDSCEECIIWPEEAREDYRDELHLAPYTVHPDQPRATIPPQPRQRRG